MRFFGLKSGGEKDGGERYDGFDFHATYYITAGCDSGCK
jgi:hypothetical protein